MIHKEDFEQRLKNLDWTLYKLAKEFAEYRATEGDVSPASRYHSSIGKAIENPGKSRLETIEDIVQVLNGELTILWDAKKVVTIRLEDETLEALKQRAENEGKTINEIAKQLLLQALSGLPAQKSKQVTNLVIGEEARIYRSFHPIIASAYSAVHQWLGEIPDAQGYKEFDYEKDILHCLEKGDLKSTAFQFYSLFPRYYFESVHILDKIIKSRHLLSRIKYNPRICLIDVGGMGAASVAFIERILAWYQDEEIVNPIEIICLGIEPDFSGVTLYSKLMNEVKNNVKSLNINLEFQIICDSVSKGIITTMRYLQKKRELWGQPVISNLIITQLDITSALNKEAAMKREQYEKLKSLGLETELILPDEKELWLEECLSYKQLLEEVPLENLHLLTLGTKKMNRHLYQNYPGYKLDGATIEIISSIEQVIGDSHHLSKIESLEKLQQVNFNNPIDSYWQHHHKYNHSSSFPASFVTITNSELSQDNNWAELTDLKNLELAWVRARKNVLDEFLYDEIEILLFERNLEHNLREMQQQLIDYIYSINARKEVISANLPKGSNSIRPKELSRLEEEVLANAIIQVIGQKINIDFYSYKPNKKSYENENEYLYASWWDEWDKFRKDIQKSLKIQKNRDGAVIRTDIQAYYTMIKQNKLLNIVQEALKINRQGSDRIDWLLRKLIYKDLTYENSAEIREKIGLNQGTITSGFYANLYLLSLDNRFKNNKEFQLEFYRYVDDIIMILPSSNTEYIDKVKTSLHDELEKLGLVLNEDKTDIYENIKLFSDAFADDDKLKPLSKEFNLLMYNLWLMNYEYRIKFRFAHNSDQENLWWELIKTYQQCLFSINIYVDSPYLSRKVFQVLFQHSENKINELNLPTFPKSSNFNIVFNWKRGFENSAGVWLDDKNKLKQKIITFFYDSLASLETIIEQIRISKNITLEEKRKLKNKRREQETRLRFAVNKLAILGFDDLWKKIVQIICDEKLFVIRDLLDVIVSLARQGHTEAIQQLRDNYINKTNETSKYLRAVILEAMRYLPNIDIQDWEFIVKLALEGQSDIERLKATETWLYLGDIAKQFENEETLKSISKLLENSNELNSRLKKNYILILGLHDPEKLANLPNIEDLYKTQDYLISDSCKLVLNGKVSAIFEQDEPAIIRSYYSLKASGYKEDKPYQSLGI
ncbi:MAG: reverse transcriptase domain-containing protein [Sphaerospermopsis sp.]|nr:reverse transcriptase domain-containing protein [Sphaerospermopsis sp.]